MTPLPMDRVLVVAAHPDDDILGCGATLARLSRSGAAIRVLFLADGVGSREDQPQRDSERREDARRALAEIGVEDSVFASLPDNALDTVPLLELCRMVTEEVDAFAPDTVLTHSLADLNIDHRLSADAAMVACRPQPSSSVRHLLHFEVPSATGWRPSGHHFDPRYHVDVTDHVEAKMAALRTYDVEMRPWPHARSYDAVLAQLHWRGASVGVPAAESFEVSLWLERA
jgi:LmbE family N-acetylglucosaminyl deacetylase